MEPIERYLRAWSCAEDPLLAELDRETHRRTEAPRMISGPVQGKLLEMLARMICPRNVLEIGTFTGYSALCMAAGSPDDTHIDTIEIDDELEEIARNYFSLSPVGRKIDLHIGSALEIAPRLGRTYDFVFIDGDKREYPAYWHMLMGNAAGTQALVGQGSWIIADNILWYGKVADPAARDPFTTAILEFNRLVHDDPRTENVILPLRDGLNLIRIL